MEKKVSHRHLHLNKLQICHCDVRRKGNTVMKMTVKNYVQCEVGYGEKGFTSECHVTF